MSRRDRRAHLRNRPPEMKAIEAVVATHSADVLHRRLVADGIARIPPKNPAELYWVQCAYVRIAQVRRLKGGPDEALAMVTEEVREATGLPMPTFR